VSRWTLLNGLSQSVSQLAESQIMTLHSGKVAIHGKEAEWTLLAGLNAVVRRLCPL